MSEDYLSREDFRSLKELITQELNASGFSVSLSDWEPGEMAWDILSVNSRYHIFLSSRRDNCFGFGITDMTTMIQLINAHVEYTGDVRATIRQAIRTLSR